MGRRVACLENTILLVFPCGMALALHGHDDGLPIEVKCWKRLPIQSQGSFSSIRVIGRTRPFAVNRRITSLTTHRVGMNVIDEMPLLAGKCFDRALHLVAKNDNGVGHSVAHHAFVAESQANEP